MKLYDVTVVSLTYLILRENTQKYNKKVLKYSLHKELIFLVVESNNHVITNLVGISKYRTDKQKRYGKELIHIFIFLNNL